MSDCTGSILFSQANARIYEVGCFATAMMRINTFLTFLSAATADALARRADWPAHVRSRTDTSGTAFIQIFESRAGLVLPFAVYRCFLHCKSNCFRSAARTPEFLIIRLSILVTNYICPFLGTLVRKSVWLELPFYCLKICGCWECGLFCAFSTHQLIFVISGNVCNKFLFFPPTQILQ